MAKKTLLEIVNTAQAELGLTQSSTIIGNTDPTTVQMLALLNLELDELRKEKQQGWTVLQTEFNLSVLPPVTITGDLNTDSDLVTGITSGLTTVDAQFWVAFATGLPAQGGGVRVILTSATATTIQLNMLAVASVTGASILLAKDTYELPADFDRYIGNTWWDRTNMWALFGPDSPQVDQLHRSGIFTTGPRRHFRQIGPYENRYRLWPAPAELVTPLQLVFEYISNAPVVTGSDLTPSGLVTKQYFTVDTDTCLLDDRALIMGLKWRFWAQKGLNWVPLATQYKNYIEILKSRDGGNTTKSLVRSPTPYLINSSQIQDGNFPGSGLDPNTGS